MADSDHEYRDPEEGASLETYTTEGELSVPVPDEAVPETGALDSNPGQVHVQEQDLEVDQTSLGAEEEERGRKRSKREERRKGKRRRAESKGKEKEVEHEREDPIMPPEVELPPTGVRRRVKKSPSVSKASEAPVEPPVARPPATSSIPSLRFSAPDLSKWKVHVDPKARTWAGLAIILSLLSCVVLYFAITVVLHFNEFQPESRAELPVLVTLNVANVPKFKETILRELRPLGMRRDDPGQGQSESLPSAIMDCAGQDLDGECDDWAYRPQEDPEVYGEETTGVVKTDDKPAPRSGGLESAYEGVNLNITNIPWHTAPITDEFTMVMQFVPGDTAADSKLKRRRVSIDALEALLQVQFAPVVANRRRQLFIKNNRLSANEESVMTTNFEKDLNAYTQRIKREKKKALSQLDELDPFTRNLAMDDMANRQAQLEKKGAAQGARCICNEMVGSVSRFAFSCLSDEDLASARDGAPQCRLFIDPELEPSWDLVTKDSYRVGCFHQDPEWRPTLEALANALGIESQSDGSCPLHLGRNYQTRVSYSEAPPTSEMFWFYGPNAYTALHLELHMHKEKVTYEKQRVSGSTLVWASKWMLNRLSGDQAGSRVRFQDRNAYRYNVIQQRETMKREVMSNASLLQEAERDKARLQDRTHPPAQDPPMGMIQALGSVVRAAATTPPERDGGLAEPAPTCLKKIGMQKRLTLDSLNQTAFYSEPPKCIEEDFDPPKLTRKEEILAGHHAACVAQCVRANKIVAALVLEAKETDAASLRAIRAVLEELRGPKALKAIYVRPTGVGKARGGG